MARARILVIEDDRFYIEFYRDILQKEGYKLEIARDGTEALKRMSEAPFDLIITGVVLKGVSGLELLSEIKKINPMKDVIMVTSMQSIRKAVDALKLGASDYLTKPVDKDELLLAINKILERQVVSQEHSKLISENIHFYELLRIQKKSLSLLTIINLEKLLDSVLDTIIQELNAHGGAFFLWDRDVQHYILTASRGIFDASKENLDLNFMTGSLRSSMENGRVIMESKDGDQWIPKTNNESHRLIFPVCYRRDILGAVKLASRRGDRPYNNFDIDLGKHILDAAGKAIKNALSIREVIARHIHGKPEKTYTSSYFMTFAETQLNVARRYNREAALLLLSLDNYQPIAKRFKENQIDRIIEHFCRIILELIRETDLLARLDEDLFGVFVPETDYYGALMLKKRIKAKLARTTFPLDIKRDLIPIVHVGCSACPRDDNNYQSLMETARKRLEDERQSVYLELKADNLNLWDMVSYLADPEVINQVGKQASGHGQGLNEINLTEDNFQTLTRNLLKDLKNFYNSRGLLYLGMGTMDPASPVYLETESKENPKMSIFALGIKGPKMWNLSHITPVFINDEFLSKHLFVLGMTEYFSYALFCRKEQDKIMRGFHSCDHLLVLELIARLQERYLLQRRIG